VPLVFYAGGDQNAALEDHFDDGAEEDVEPEAMLDYPIHVPGTELGRGRSVVAP
jgi:hypothetical protein